MKKKQKSLRCRLGVFFIFLALVSPALSLLVPFLDLSTSISAVVVGLLWVGAPELFFIVGAALAGKEVLLAIKKKIKALFGFEDMPKPVSRVRYSIGLILLIGSICGNWAFQYLRLALDLGIGKGTSLILIFSIDLVLISSFFVLGNQFWDKFCRLFVWEGAMIRHIVILQFKKGSHEEYLSLLEKTRPILAEIPGIISFHMLPNESKYVLEGQCSIGVEIIFKDQESLEIFMEHPLHYEANTLFEAHLADPPYMVFTHRL